MEKINYRKEIAEMTIANKKKLVELAESVLSLTDEKRTLFYTILELVADDPEKLEFAKNWKGSMKDLPDALAQI